jgi:myo-inositol-1(or 4)-monophosphatase
MSILDFAVDLAREAGELALGYYKERQHLCVERKGRLDLVTRADRDVEDFLRKRIKDQFPADAFFGEESSQKCRSSGRTWVVDPIDGTFNFLRGNNDWGIVIGVLEDSVPQIGVVNAPARNELLIGGPGHSASLNGVRMMPASESIVNDGVVGLGFGASVSVDSQIALIRFITDDCGMTFRRNGASSVSLIMLAQGQIDAFVGLGLRSWDVLGGIIVAQELGYSCSIDWSRTLLTEKIDLACAPEPILKRLSSVLP